MKLHLNLSLRRALLATFAGASALVSTVYAGVVDERYDLQYYLDFARNKGMFSAGATNIGVFFKDGTRIDNNVIPLMPNFDSYGQTVAEIVALPGTNPRIASNGGTNLVSAQFVYGAKHVHDKIGNTDVAFLSENASTGCIYDSANLDTFGHDSSLQRLTKLVTSVAYTPMADDTFMDTISTNSTWIYRLGNGGAWSAGESINTYDNTLGGVINLSNIERDTSGNWHLEGWARYSTIDGDILTPLDIGTYFGDSGSPSFAWDDTNNRFVFISAMWASGVQTKFPNWYLPSYNPSQAVDIMNKYTVTASFTGTDTIEWGTQDSKTGKGMLTQGSATAVVYTGQGSENGIADSLGLTFSSTSENEQTLELQGNVNMGAGALTFENGKWKLTEQADQNFTLHSAGFDIRKDAEVTWELTGSSGQEIRKVGEGTLTISGSGNNESTLVVGGGATVYEVTRDDNGNITGCRLGNAGETRLNRTGGYAASSVRLEGGVAIIVLMGSNQFKANSVAGDTFTFGNDGGLLNLNGHDLEWGVINQQGSGKGARIGNFTPQCLSTPQDATFTYTGTGTFDGCFMDEAGSGKGTAQLSVCYNKAGGTWYLTGNHSNAGGFNVQAGTMVLQGTNTPHVMMTDSADWTYASIQGSDVAVQSGATFQLSHHALMEGNVVVENGGTFIINQAVNAASESINGSLRQDMSGIKSLIGDVTLKESGSSTAQMVANISSPVTTIIDGNISISLDTGASYKSVSLVKKGNGILSVTGSVNLFGVSIEEGGLVIGKGAENDNFNKWTIGEKGFLASVGVTNLEYLLSSGKITEDSSGVLALTADQTSEFTGAAISNGLYIGAYGEEAINYGEKNTTTALTAYHKEWHLGGGTGTLNVHFLLTGDNNLIIGNEYSSGTVHLTNTANDFTGDIYIKGTGNMLTYEAGALGAAKVALSYGNILGLHDASLLTILKEGTQGILALNKDMSLDMSGMSDEQLSIAAQGDVTLTQAVIVADDTYRFGGYGNLTLANDLSGASSMRLDGQGNTGSSVTFANANAFSGSITAGGGLGLPEANSTGSIDIHVAHEQALANTGSIELQKGAVLHTDGQNLVVNNLTAQSGAAIQNKGETATLLQLNVEQGKSVSIANGVLSDANNNASLALVKTGSGILDMGANTTWSGGLTIMEGQVNASIANGGIGAEGSSVYVKDGATLSLTATGVTDNVAYAQTIFRQVLTGDGEVSISNGTDMLFLTQASGFEGQVKVTGNTRLYITKSANITSQNSFSTSQAFDKATIVVEAGSQARVTPSIYCLSDTQVNSWADYVIAGSDYKGGSSDFVQSQHDGALVIDSLATVWGNVTLAEDAMIASWSENASAQKNYYGSFAYQCLTEGTYAKRYGIINKLGGIIRGQILGEGKTLTFGGNEGMTITADSANTYGDLVIASGNGHNDDKFALRLDSGAARSQTSTALGLGSVQLNGGLILRLAGTGVENNSDVVYTYANTMKVGADATIQSHNITNRLTGTVTMTGTSLNLATAHGGVLELAGGISGSGTLNIGADSRIIIGTAATGTDAPQFSGSVITQAGADITLASASVVSTTTTFTGTDSLTLHLGGTADYTLGGISVGASGETASTLNLSFDFTGIPDAEQADTWTTLTSSISAGNTVIDLELNMFDDISKGSYTLITQAGDSTYSLADDMNGRLSLTTNGDGALVLIVGNDNRLFWRSGGDGTWAGTNWYSDAVGGKTTFSPHANIMLNADGVATGNNATSRETITLSSDQTAGTIGAQQAAYEITGNGSLTATRLTVGNKGDMKLSNTGSNTFSEGVRVNDAALTVSGGGTLTASVQVENGASFTLIQGSMAGNLSVTDATASIQNAAVAGNINTYGSGTLNLNSATFSNTARDVTFDYGKLAVTAGTTLSGTYTWEEYQPTVTVQDMAISGGNVTSSMSMAVNGLNIATGKALFLTGSASSTLDSVTSTGSVAMQSSGTLQLGNAQLLSLSVLGGTTNVTGAVTISGRGTTASGINASAAQLSIGKATLNIEEGGSISVERFTAGNEANDNPSVININGGSLTITGNNDTDTTSNSCLLAHWKNSASTLVLNGGTLNVQNASLLMGWDSSGRFEVHSGTANLKGIRFSGQRSNADTLLLGTAESGSGRINLGSGGITGIGNNDTVNLGNGTIGALADYAISGHKEVNLIGTNNGTQFDTAGYTVTVNTALAGAGNMLKSGSGTLLLAGNGTAFSGNITVEEGSLAITQDGKSVLESASSVIIDGGTLDISRLNLSGTDDAIRIAAGQTFTLSDNASINFGNISANTEYHIFDFSSGLVDGWSSENLSAEEIIIGGVKLSDMGRGANYSISMDGFFSYTLLGDRVVKWNGGTTPSLWTQSDTDTAWTDSSNASTTFVNFDSVAFESGADLTLEGDIHVDNLTVAEGVSLKTAGQLTVHGAMTLGNGFNWDFSGNTTLSFTEATLMTAGKIVVGDGATLVMTNKTTAQNKTSSAFNKVSGTGHIILNLEADNGVGFNLSAFTGDVTVATGRLQVNTSTFNDASTIYLSTSGSQLVFNANSELKNDVVLGADTTFHVNKPQNGLYTGTISGDLLGEDRKLTKAGGSTLILQGRTTLKTLETKTGQVIIDSPYALIEMVDGAMANAATGNLKLAEGASLRVTGDVWSRNNTGILVEKGAELALLKHEICIINTNGEETSLKATTSGGQLYSLANSDYEIKNARVVFTGSESATLGNKLTNVTLENSISNAVAPANLEDGADDTVYAGSKLTVTHAQNTLNGVIAYGGDIALHNLQSETELNLLEIAAGKTVSAYVGDATDECSTVKVTESLLLSGSSTLNASLTLADGATLEMTGLENTNAAVVNGALTFEGSVTLGSQLLASVEALECGDSLTLFIGLSSLTLPDEADLNDGMGLSANTLFSNVQDTNLYVNYHMVGDVGSLSIAYIPEPTTSTLSLLALAGLCARRRRK